MMNNITSQNITELIKNIKDKKISSEEVTKSFIEKAEKAKTLNCYITEDFDSAIKKAKNFDNSSRGPTIKKCCLNASYAFISKNAANINTKIIDSSPPAT